MSDIFERARPIALGLIKTWLPGGYIQGGQWVVKNPTRADNKAGSFLINLSTGKWNDYADEGGAYGHDAISLYGYLNGMRNYDAAKEILSKYDPSWFPGNDDREDKRISWYQLDRGCKNEPEFPKRPNETMRWPLQIQSGKEWRTVMMIVRSQNGDEKQDLPWSLWTDGKNIEWRNNALKDVKYPLYNLKGLADFPNAPFILYEGQKVPSVVQPVVGEEYVCIGWYGGALNTDKTDFSPLVGRHGYFCFDADSPGRKTISKIVDEYHIFCTLVSPPDNVPKGWDHADGIASGWTKEDIIASLKGETTSVIPMDWLDIVDVVESDSELPLSLDAPVTPETKEHVLSSIFIPAQDGYRLRKDWFFWIVENDKVIHNCIKYDYTTGTKATAYESSEIFDASLEHRLALLGVPANVVTKNIKERMCNEIVRVNSRYNRVADYMDRLTEKYPHEKQDVLSEFMKIFEFNIEKEYGETGDDYIEKRKKIIGLYRELFNIFFIRMHARINGTRKQSDGSYKGLLQNDVVPILEGPQQIGKTTMCRWLSCEDELYVDLGSGMKQGFGAADTVKKVRGRLIAEIGEMKIMKNPESLETIKSFISMKAATIDIKFIEAQRDIPMTVSFIGTSNPDQYLSDETGNLRFWPVKLKGIDKDFMSANLELPKRLHAYYTKLTMNMNEIDVFNACKPSDELNDLMESMRKDALITYSDYEVCLKEIKKWILENALTGGTLCQADVEKMGVDDGYPTRISQRSFKRAIMDAGFVQERKFDKELGRSMLTWTYHTKDEVPF